MQSPAKPKKRSIAGQKGVIFDMDGVLFPTEELKFAAYQKVFHDVYGIEIEETPKRLGLSEAKVMELFLKKYGKQGGFSKIPELIQKKREAYYTILAKYDLCPTAGVEDLLKELRNDGGFKIGLATMSNQKSMKLLMERFNLEKYFDSLLSLECVTKPKPDPEIYLLSAEQLRVHPEDCVVFEDSPPGVRAAKAAGMRCVVIATDGDFKRLNAGKIRGFFDNKA
jgi:beta-phosphoglucomutase